jgi:hypothetical protein
VRADTVNYVCAIRRAQDHEIRDLLRIRFQHHCRPARSRVDEIVAPRRQRTGALLR